MSDDIRGLLRQAKGISGSLDERYRRMNVVLRNTDTLIRFMHRKVVIHEYTGYVAGVLVACVLNAYEHSFWTGTALALGVVVVIDFARNWYVRRVARKMFATDPQP